jgi:hypothetical protein
VSESLGLSFLSTAGLLVFVCHGGCCRFANEMISFVLGNPKSAVPVLGDVHMPTPQNGW